MDRQSAVNVHTVVRSTPEALLSRGPSRWRDLDLLRSVNISFYTRNPRQNAAGYTVSSVNKYMTVSAVTHL